MDNRFPDFETTIQSIALVSSVGELRRLAFRLFRRMSFRRIVYVHSSAVQPQLSFIDQIGFPTSFSERYQYSSLQFDDPFPKLAMNAALPVRWSQYGNRSDLSVRHKAYISRLRELDIGDGYSVFVSGPNGRDGYFALGYGGYGQQIPHDKLLNLQLVCQAIHNTLCRLTSDNDARYEKLSARECEVLYWMAKGKSSSATAGILGLSPHTVNTLCKRLFLKLGATDKITAVIRGLGTGAIPHNASGS